MIIDKVTKYWTAEELEEREAIRKELESLDLDENGKIPKRFGELLEAIYKLRDKAEERYIKARSKKGILDDVREIVNSIEQKDFKEYINQRYKKFIAEKERLNNVGGEDKELEDQLLYLYEKHAREDYSNCFQYILKFLRVQLNAFANDPENTSKIEAIVDKRVSLWYINPEPAYIPMAHGKATDALAYMSTRNAQIDDITGNAIIDRFGVKLAIMKLNELHATLGISTDKLLSTALAEFTKHNDFRHTAAEPKREVTLPLKEYAKKLGYDVEERQTGSPEEAQKEKKRAKNQLDNARKAIKEDLLILQASTLRWEETIKGKPKDFDSISLVTRVGIKNGEIKIAFSPEIARYLSERNLITQYPAKLLGISGRQPNAYYIGRKLASHYNIDSNQVKGTHDRIGIPALLAVTDLPSYEEVQKTNRSWGTRIKEPFEQALDTLQHEGILKDWKYTHAKGIDLTDEEAENINTYRAWEELYINFILTDTVDQAERIEKKQKERAEAINRKKRKQRANKKKITKEQN